MANEGGEAAGRPAGAGLCRVTHHDKIISSAGHWRCRCCCYRADHRSFPSLTYCHFDDIITMDFLVVLCNFCSLAFYKHTQPMSNLSLLKALFTTVCTVVWYCVWMYVAGRGGALTLGYCSCCGLWLVLHLHGLCNLSLKDYCWFLAGRGNLCTRD